MTTVTLTCNFPGCGREVKPETALVPKIEAIRQAEGGKPISVETLARHVFCEEHGALGRSFAGGMFPYLKTVEQLEARARDRATANQFFAKYGAPALGKPGAKQNRPNPRSDVMKIALVNAGVAKAAGA